MIFVETPIFTKQVLQALSADQYRVFQEALVDCPDAGDRIPGGGEICASCAGRDRDAASAAE